MLICEASLNINSHLREFLSRHTLGPDYLTTVETWFSPLADQLADKQQRKGSTLYVGINGCQGSGKSTLAELLSLLLTHKHGLHCVNLSLDDFYYSAAKRRQLAQEIHPLLATRGAPGTHDTPLMRQVLTSLAHNEPTLVTRFNKATDNPEPREHWKTHHTAVDVIIVEGWSWGVKAQAQDALTTPVNSLERTEDPNGKWRQHTNQCLKQDYEPLYELMDHWVMLQAPSFEQVLEWRLEQETKLAERHKGNASLSIMSRDQIQRFIQHYQRLTEHALESLPKKVEPLFHFSDHRPLID